MRRWPYMVKPSLRKNSDHEALVTRLPNHECVISCATTSHSDWSPATSAGVTNVRHGFSMPPYANAGGITSRSYRLHEYSPNSLSPAARYFSTISPSPNSAAAAASPAGSVHTRERGPMRALARSPTAIASRYTGTLWLMTKEYSSHGSPPTSTARASGRPSSPTAGKPSQASSATSGAGTHRRAANVTRNAGVSWHGSSPRLHTAWPML
mmetsp:Transcript_8450/g.30044  ORF Transcript_8450/g.30044 Transcript_8450/m.30044 type:complete len:210 (-) Transcript_8450:492-1121(-)